MWFNTPCCAVWPSLSTGRLVFRGKLAEWEVIRVCRTIRTLEWIHRDHPKGLLGLTEYSCAVQSYKSQGCLWVCLKVMKWVCGQTKSQTTSLSLLLVFNIYSLGNNSRILFFFILGSCQMSKFENVKHCVFTGCIHSQSIEWRSLTLW